MWILNVQNLKACLCRCKIVEHLLLKCQKVLLWSFTVVYKYAKTFKLFFFSFLIKRHCFKHKLFKLLIINGRILKLKFFQKTKMQKNEPQTYILTLLLQRKLLSTCYNGSLKRVKAVFCGLFLIKYFLIMYEHNLLHIHISTGSNMFLPVLHTDFRIKFIVIFIHNEHSKREVQFVVALFGHKQDAGKSFRTSYQIVLKSQSTAHR